MSEIQDKEFPLGRRPPLEVARLALDRIRVKALYLARGEGVRDDAAAILLEVETVARAVDELAGRREPKPVGPENERT